MFNFRYNSKLIFTPANYLSYYKTPLGIRLWKFLIQEEVVKRMAYFADANVTPAEGIDREINLKFGKELKGLGTKKYHIYKQMIGRMIKEILVPHGYEHINRGYNVRNGEIFRLASKYKKNTKI